MEDAGGADAGALAPVVRRLKLPCSPEQAFDAFTRRIGEWWPPAFTASGDVLAGVVLEGRTGGRVFETSAGGAEFEWGSVTAFGPDRRVVLLWTLGLQRGTTSEVEVRFSGAGEACELRLEHRGWNLDQASDRAKFADGGGWSVVLDAYQEFAAIGRPAPPGPATGDD
jgi:hypothetical protein